MNEQSPGILLIKTNFLQMQYLQKHYVHSVGLTTSYDSFPSGVK